MVTKTHRKNIMAREKNKQRCTRQTGIEENATEFDDGKAIKSLWLHKKNSYLLMDVLEDKVEGVCAKGRQCTCGWTTSEMIADAIDSSLSISLICKEKKEQI